MRPAIHKEIKNGISSSRWVWQLTQRQFFEYHLLENTQNAFRKATVVGDISNSDYFGEIDSQGDTVKIIKEPEITVKEYARGTTVAAQDLDDEDFSLT